ncbi:Cell surface protein [Oopsacas minuta]|uniref:Cell surface protein n=1 Tax=Oopsacas minuta TaxID=111878 RepID=A0AAV7K952_9METZ|nr:Cell surface protein [Oopsacas minuta]
MATADAPEVNTAPVVEKIYREDKRAQYFKEELTQLKQEIADEFEKIHTVLREEESKLQNEIDMNLHKIEELVNKRADRVNQLKKGLEELEQGLAHNNLTHLLADARIKIDKEIDKLLHQERLELPQIQLQCKPTNLNRYNLCKLEDKTHPYTYRHDPAMSCVSTGEKGGLTKPRGLAIDNNGIVYIADYTKSQIEVYSQDGEHINTLVDRKMREPLYLCVSADNLYVSCENRCLLRLSIGSGKRTAIIETQLHISGMCIDAEYGLIGCIWQKNRICLFDNQLDKKGEIQLNTKHHKPGVTFTADIKVTYKQELAVLFYKSSYPLQVFNREGELISCLLSQDQVGGALYFCLDSYDNILITDISAHQLKIFTPQGDLLTRIGKKGQQQGDFQTPVGVSVNQSGDVYVCDCKQNYMLQMF